MLNDFNIKPEKPFLSYNVVYMKNVHQLLLLFSDMQPRFANDFCGSACKFTGMHYRMQQKSIQGTKISWFEKSGHNWTERD
jgi:hypothetical protein